MSAIALRMPNCFDLIEEEEMEYVEGGAYISYQTCRAIVLTIAFNPIAATLVGIGLNKLACIITASGVKIGLKIGGTIGGIIGSAIGGALGGLLTGTAAWTLARAIIEKKGIGIDPCYIRNTNIVYMYDVNIR